MVRRKFIRMRKRWQRTRRRSFDRFIRFWKTPCFPCITKRTSMTGWCTGCRGSCGYRASCLAVLLVDSSRQSALQRLCMLLSRDKLIAAKMANRESLQGTDRQGEIRKKRSPPTRACPSTSGEIKPMPCASTALRKSIGIRIIKQGLDFLTNETTRATGIYADGACCLIEVPR